MKKLKILVIFCLVCLICIQTGFSAQQSTPKIVQKTPAWADEYEKKSIKNIKLNAQGGLLEAVNPKFNIKIIGRKDKEGNSILSLYRNGKLVKDLLNSKIDFIHGQWSSDFRFFTIVNLTYAEDYAYDGNIYVFFMDQRRFDLIYADNKTGANPGAFSNKAVQIAYWSDAEGLYIVDLKTKKATLRDLKLDPNGKATFIAWNKNDNELFFTLVAYDEAKDYLLSL